MTTYSSLNFVKLSFPFANWDKFIAKWCHFKNFCCSQSKLLKILYGISKSLFHKLFTFFFIYLFLSLEINFFPTLSLEFYIKLPNILLFKEGKNIRYTLNSCLILFWIFRFLLILLVLSVFYLLNLGYDL